MCPFREIKVSFDDNGRDNDLKIILVLSPPPPVVGEFLLLDYNFSSPPVRLLKTNVESGAVM